MGDDKVQSLSMHGLRSACGYLQSKLADRLQTRCTPVLTFVLDPSVKVSVATSTLIRSALADGIASPSAETDDDEPEDGVYEDDPSYDGGDRSLGWSRDGGDDKVRAGEELTGEEGGEAGGGTGTADAKEACAEANEPPSG
jgi:ribosome-binding factor A